MLNRLSTFNSKLLTTAFPWTVLIIVIAELVFANNLHRKYFSHEVDEVLYEVEYRDFQSQVVLLGDSVGRQVTRKWHVKPRRYAALATNQAIEMFGQYAILMRYLEHNPDPHAVVYTGHSPFGFNLNSPLTENYVQRCFTRWDEIAAMTKARRSITFGSQTALYRMLPSYKYRLHLQKELTGFTNADIYSGFHPEGPPRKGTAIPGLFKEVGQALIEQRKTDISDEFFMRIIELCEERGIVFYYLPAPMRETAYKQKQADLSRFHERLRQLDQEHRAFFFLEAEFRIYPDALFIDNVHVNESGLRQAHTDTLQVLTDIVLKNRPEYQE